MLNQSLANFGPVLICLALSVAVEWQSGELCQLSLEVSVNNAIAGHIDMTGLSIV